MRDVISYYKESKMIKRAFSIIFLIIFLPIFSFVHTTYAEDTPSVVYRLDGRSPSQIFFGGGFASWGGEHASYDLLFHVSGASIETQDSGYISTTASMDALYRMARQQLIANPQETYWVYDITPGMNFFYIPSSLLITALHADNEVQANNVMSLYNTFGWQEEWAAANLIPSESIYSARSVMLQEGQVVFGPRTLNPNFIPSQPRTNPNPLISNHYAFLEAYYAGEDSLTAMAVSFFAEHSRQASSNNHHVASCSGVLSSSRQMMRISLTRDLIHFHNPACAKYKHSFEDIWYKTKLLHESL